MELTLPIISEIIWGGVVICKSYEEDEKSPKKKEKQGKLIVKNGGKLSMYSLNGD